MTSLTIFLVFCGTGLGFLAINGLIHLDGEIIYFLSFCFLLVALAFSLESEKTSAHVTTPNYLLGLWRNYRGTVSRYTMLVDSTKVLIALYLRRYLKVTLTIMHAKSTKNRFLPVSLKHGLLSLL